MHVQVVLLDMVRRAMLLNSLVTGNGELAARHAHVLQCVLKLATSAPPPTSTSAVAAVRLPHILVNLNDAAGASAGGALLLVEQHLTDSLGAAQSMRRAARPRRRRPACAHRHPQGPVHAVRDERAPPPALRHPPERASARPARRARGHRRGAHVLFLLRPVVVVVRTECPRACANEGKRTRAVDSRRGRERAGGVARVGTAGGEWRECCTGQ